MASYVYAPFEDLVATIQANLQGVAVQAIGYTTEGELRVVVDKDLDPYQKAVLDQLLADRSMAPSPTTVVFHGSRGLVDLPVEITSSDDWQVIGGLVTNASFFVEDLVRAMGRVTGSFQASGVGAEIRVVEDDGKGDEQILGLWQIDDTGGAWAMLNFNTTTPPRPGDMTYRFEGRLNGAASASTRFVTISLLELLIT